MSLKIESLLWILVIVKLRVVYYGVFFFYLDFDILFKFYVFIRFVLVILRVYRVVRIRWLKFFEYIWICYLLGN